MFEVGKLYKIIRARTGCRGIESAIVEYLEEAKEVATNGLYADDINVCKVKTVKLNDAWGKVDDIWCINTDCEYEELENIQTKVKLSWKNVFNCKKLYPLDIYGCMSEVLKTQYEYMCFNNKIYKINNDNKNKSFSFYCEESELGE